MSLNGKTQIDIVTAYAAVWIEIVIDFAPFTILLVTAYAAVWIEIIVVQYHQFSV